MGVQYDDEGTSNEVILRVKSSSSAASVASALSHAVYDGKRVALRAIGAGAVNQALKAIAIANSFVAPRGIMLDCRPGFTTVTTPDAGDISAIVLRIIVR
uniref:Stage V sporulation protein S n=1 Tax=Streptomyces sp. NBC_01393 TaxID=2903851 RepID=A0AAU3I5T0_9ACTN